MGDLIEKLSQFESDTPVQLNGHPQYGNPIDVSMMYGCGTVNIFDEYDGGECGCGDCEACVGDG